MMEEVRFSGGGEGQKGGAQYRQVEVYSSSENLSSSSDR